MGKRGLNTHRADYRGSPRYIVYTIACCFAKDDSSRFVFSSTTAATQEELASGPKGQITRCFQRNVTCNEENNNQSCLSTCTADL